jgi:hypothetical protein
MENTTDEDRETLWQTHLSAELDSPATIAFVLIISRSTTAILYTEKLLLNLYIKYEWMSIDKIVFVWRIVLIKDEFWENETKLK